VKRLLSAVTVIGSVCLLASCSLLPSLPHDEDEKATAQMQRIADAVKDHDATALKSLFSSRAREKAVDLDNGLEYFLSVFPSGKMSWKLYSFDSSTSTGFLKETEETFSLYKVSAEGKKYYLFIADYPVNQVDDPQNVGIYALGVTPYTTQVKNPDGTDKPFFSWEGSFRVNPPAPSGDPGIYVPPE